MMKNHSLYFQGILNLLSLLFIFTGINSCCQVDCPDADKMDGVHLLNFTTTDIDSIFVISYLGNTDFNEITDSFMIDDSFTPGDNTSYIVFNGKSINLENDYRILFSKINKEYKITRFRSNTEKCDRCRPRSLFLHLEGYEVNSKPKTLGYIEIDKDSD